MIRYFVYRLIIWDRMMSPIKGGAHHVHACFMLACALLIAILSALMKMGGELSSRLFTGEINPELVVFVMTFLGLAVPTLIAVTGSEKALMEKFSGEGPKQRVLGSIVVTLTMALLVCSWVFL